jgi:hypothetical protein
MDVSKKYTESQLPQFENRGNEFDGMFTNKGSSSDVKMHVIIPWPPIFFGTSPHATVQPFWLASYLALALHATCSSSRATPNKNLLFSVALHLDALHALLYRPLCLHLHPPSLPLIY